MSNAGTYLIYLMVSLGITLSVARILRQHGLVFLSNHLAGNQNLAVAINNMLLIGFYLVNIGYILLVLNLNPVEALDTIGAMVHFMTLNIGLVTLMLGAMHLILFYVLANWQPQNNLEIKAGE